MQDYSSVIKTNDYFGVRMCECTEEFNHYQRRRQLASVDDGSSSVKVQHHKHCGFFFQAAVKHTLQLLTLIHPHPDNLSQAAGALKLIYLILTTYQTGSCVQTSSPPARRGCSPPTADIRVNHNHFLLSH